MQRVVGRVLRPHGVSGELVVELRTDRPDQRFAPGSEVVADDGRTFLVRSARPHADRLLVRLGGVPDRTSAELLRGMVLAADVPEQEASSDADTFPDGLLVGMEARDRTGRRVGQVCAVEHGRLQDLLVLRLDAGALARVPFVAALVPVVDRHGRYLVLDPPDGLLDLDTGR